MPLKRIDVNDLVSRFHFIYSALPTAEEWNSWGERSRSKYLLDILNQDGDYYNDNLIFIIYVKAHRIYFDVGPTIIIDLNINHSQLLEIFCLAAKYAKNWIFA